MGARRHHYLSQCYLKGFVADRGSPLLFVVDKEERRSFKTSPTNVAAERDFHAIDVDGHPPDALEREFSKFETDLDQALRRIVAARSIANEHHRALLFNLIGMAATKNPRLREAGRKVREQFAKMTLDTITSAPERFAAHVRGAQTDRFIDPDEKDYAELRQLIERDVLAMTVPTTEHLQIEMATVDEVLPYIFERQWVLFRAQPGRTGFITSDHPSCQRTLRTITESRRVVVLRRNDRVLGIPGRGEGA